MESKRVNRKLFLTFSFILQLHNIILQIKKTDFKTNIKLSPRFNLRDSLMNKERGMLPVATGFSNGKARAAGNAVNGPNTGIVNSDIGEACASEGWSLTAL